MDNKLDFLDGDAPADLPTPVVEATQAEAPSGPARGDDGKFVSTAEPTPPAAPVAAAEPAPVAPPPPEPAHAPLSALLDERERRQAAERERDELRKAQQRPPEPVTVPDPYEDPNGYQAFQAQQTQQAALNIRLDLSEDLARGKHGDALVDQARDWALERMAKSPAFNHEVLSHRNPYDFIVQQHQRDQFVSQIQPSDYEAFQAWRAAQSAAPQPAAQAASPVPPPPSLASATSAGGAASVPTAPGSAYDALFKG